MSKNTYLPLFQLVLLGFVLLDEVIEHLAQPLGVGLQRWDNILDCPLHQDAVDQAEALAAPRKWL